MRSDIVYGELFFDDAATNSHIRHIFDKKNIKDLIYFYTFDTYIELRIKFMPTMLQPH
jgi:hypothetical protein